MLHGRVLNRRMVLDLGVSKNSLLSGVPREVLRLFQYQSLSEHKGNCLAV